MLLTRRFQIIGEARSWVVKAELGVTELLPVLSCQPAVHRSCPGSGLQQLKTHVVKRRKDEGRQGRSQGDHELLWGITGHCQGEAVGCRCEIRNVATNQPSPSSTPPSAEIKMLLKSCNTQKCSKYRQVQHQHSPQVYTKTAPNFA